MSDTENSAVATAEQAPAPAIAPVATPATAAAPVPLKVFVASLAKSPDAVFALLLKQRHGHQKVTLIAWQAKLAKLRSEPAH